MESKHEAPSIILRLMGLDEVPPQHPVGNARKVLSENYMHKVASIGVRKKRRSSCQHDYFRMSSDEKEESMDTLKVVKTIRRDEYHNPSKGNWKAKGVQQMLLDDASYMSDNGKPETLVDAISSSSFGTSVSSRRMAEQGNLQRKQRLDNGLLEDVYREAGLYETFGFSKSRLDQKDETLNSRSTVLKSNSGNGLKYFSFPSSCKVSHFADGLLKETFCPKIGRVYPGMKGRKRMPFHMDFHKDSSKFISEVSEEVPIRTGNVANKVLDTVPSSFFRMNEASVNRSDMLKPTSNVSVNDTQCNSPSFCSYDSYVGSEAKNKTMKQSERGNGARNFIYRNAFSNDKIKRNIRCKVGMNYTMTNDNLFQKYWGLRKNASANWPTVKSKYQNNKNSDCLQEMNHKSSSEKSPSVSSYFNIEENCIGLHKMKKICYRNNLSDMKPMFPQFSRSGPSPTFIDSQILNETSLMSVVVKKYTHGDSNTSKQNSVSPNLLVDCLVSDAKVEVVGMSYNNPTKQQSESTEHRDSDSLNHGSYASMQQDTSESKDGSVYSIYSGTEPDSLGSFDEVYEPSPVSVLDLAFREDISSSSECLKDVDDGGYDSSEVDDEGFGLNISSDEDCGDESIGGFKEKQDLVGLFRAEESRDFSYVVEVLTEAGNSNRSLFTDFSTWHTAECPISPSVFENLEKKFGGQQFWKRSERRLLFDRINLGLFEILQPCSYIPKWEKPVSRRLNPEPTHDMIEEEMWGLLVAQEKEASKESADKMLDGEIRWTELRDDIEVIVKEIVTLLIEELADEIVSLENF
ncbi:PREDICTED: uncharacterized protein LOC109354222 isoform X2 [Lupinus angustifolius]|uniref:uncharacterized protein LOC109354222 isoform X2 n=1 Tax=Lupinus angustifolius TaxID=3871 RepID=UPI00092E2EB7|nr:PREDICTED: uncharacterized protein LOC109354222 isoform X2 [Lupinus angustifolius]